MTPLLYLPATIVSYYRQVCTPSVGMSYAAAPWVEAPHAVQKTGLQINMSRHPNARVNTPTLHLPNDPPSQLPTHPPTNPPMYCSITAGQQYIHIRVLTIPRGTPPYTPPTVRIAKFPIHPSPQCKQYSDNNLHCFYHFYSSLPSRVPGTPVALSTRHLRSMFRVGQRCLQPSLR